MDDQTLNIARFSKYCSLFINCKKNDIVSKLVDLKSNGKFNGAIIFPTHDYHVEILSKNKNLLEPELICAVDDWNKIELFQNKEKAYQFAQRLNIPISPTFKLNEINPLDDLNITFPCIIKPSVMHTFYSIFKTKVFYCTSLREIEQFILLTKGKYPLNQLLVQEIIEGNNDNQFSVGALAIEGKIILQLTVIRARQHPIDFGNATTFALTTSQPELLFYAEKILQETKYTGVCEIEFKKNSKDGMFYFLEVNTRTWKWHSIFNSAKVELLESYVKHLRNIPFVSAKKEPVAAAFIHFITDFPTRIIMIFKGMGIRKIPNNYNVEKAVWAKDDILPAIIEKLLLPFFIVKR